MNSVKKLFHFIVYLLLVGCAQVVAPTGGGKDTEPPIPIEITPENLSADFSATTIRVEFNEYIKLKNLNQNLIISPPLTEKPKIYTNKRALIIELKSDLEPNTTYTFNFGNSIQDITEGNAGENMRYILSTGSHIDSLEITGNITDALSGESEKEMFVMLYDNLADSVPLTEQPIYFTKTGKNGDFTIDFIKEGTYKIFALEDKNNNYLFDIPEEKIAFSETAIIIPDSLLTVNLKTFTEDKAPLYVKSETIGATYGKLTITPNKSFEKPDIAILQKLPLIEKAIFLTDSLLIWFKSDAEKHEFDVLVMNKKTTVDTIHVKGAELFEQKKSMHIAPVFVDIRFTPINSDRDYTLILPSDIPITKTNTNLLTIRDTVKNDTIAYTLKTIDNTIIISPKEEYGDYTRYLLTALPGAFIGIYELTNDTISYNFRTKNETSLSNLNLNLSIPEGNYILQLLSTKNTLEIPISGNTKETIKKLPPGNYDLRLIVDSNNNDKWDTGDYEKNLQPEKAIYIQKGITLKANWDFDVVWEFPGN